MKWDEEVGLLVFGAGAAGMTAALVARCEGLEVVLCEKSSQIGGTTATSGGTIWIPGNRLSLKSSNPDTIEAARTYMQAEIGPDHTLKREAFLASGAEAIDYLERHSEVKLKVLDPYPDYHAELPGGAKGGRGLTPQAFDARVLGKRFDTLRSPKPELMALGGMMVPRDEIKFMIRPWRSLQAFKVATARVVRYALDRLRYRRGTRLVLGNALVGRLYHSCLQKQVDIRLNHKLVELIKIDGKVAGAVVESPGRRLAIRARLGVVLATGGLAANRAWRDKLTGRAIPHTNAYDVASGDGVEAGLAAGAAFDKGRGTPFWWIPSSTIRWPDGRIATYPHIRDRPKPGLIAVNGKGQRFVNEASSYHDFGLAQLAPPPEDKAIPTWLICDRPFVHNYGLGVIHPVWQRVSFFEKIGYVISASTLDELARKIGVDPKALAASVEQNNRAAVTGTDEAFGKGSKAINRRDGDPEHKGPNMCIGPIAKAPFFAVPVYPAPIGSCAGLRTNGDSQVLDAQDQPIAGLYAAGNDMASVVDGTYPGPGATLGPAIVFGYRAVMHAKQISAAAGECSKDARDVERTVASVT